MVFITWEDINDTFNEANEVNEVNTVNEILNVVAITLLLSNTV